MPAGSLRYSTHAFGVAEAVEMDRALGGLPRRLTIYGIEGANFAAGEELTAEVESAARHVSSLILEGLNANPSRRLLIGPEPAVQSRLQKPDTV
jgi:hydrogenase maturation protease